MKKWKYAMESEQFLTIKKPIINLTQFGQKNNWLWTRQAVWGEIWKPTVEKNQINATNVTMPRLRQVIWKCIVEKSQTNTANVTLHVPRHLIWEDIWKHTVEKSRTNATNVTLPRLKQAIWGHIWKRTVEKRQTNAINVTFYSFIGGETFINKTVDKHIWVNC